MIPADDPNATITLDGTWTFKAQWAKDSSAKAYTLTFDAQGGTIDGVEKLEVKIDHGESYASATGWSNLHSPVREGYTFSGWFYEPLNYYLNNVDEAYGLYEDGTFYARWINNQTGELEPITYPAPPTYIVTFDPDGGVMEGPTQYEIHYGDFYLDVFGGLPAVTKEGFNFVHWYNEKYNYVLDVAPTAYYAINEDATFIAIWEEIEEECTHNWVVTRRVEPTCVKNGKEYLECSICHETMERIILATGIHTWGEWVVITPATETSEGLKRHTCKNCTAYEEEVIPKIVAGVDWEVQNFNLVIRNASEINYIRLAPGYWETSNEIRNAPGLRSFDPALIVKNTDGEGTLTIDLLREGEYSMWIRYNDQKTYVINGIIVDPTVIDPTYDGAKGLNINIGNINSDVRDIFLAPGHYTTYRQTNDNKIVRLYNFEEKTTNYGRNLTYLIDYRNVSQSGEYTLCVRYNSGRDNTFIYFTIETPKPQITVNGLQVTISGLQDIKSIRTAAGSYVTAAEVKAAPGMRAFVRNGALKNVSEANNYSYTIQYLTDGVYSISIEYQGGYVEVRQVTITSKQATVAYNDDKTVTFGNLDGLYVIRYAPGTLTAQGEFKRTEGNKYVKSNAIVNGVITLGPLTGVWSFMVQFDDNSYKIYTHNFG